MITPTIRSDGATRRFVVHAAHQTREQGRVVRAASFHEAALAYAEAWRPVPDAFGVIQLSLTDLDSGEHQDATIDVARPGVADLQVRRERLELRAVGRTGPPGAERFRVDPVEPFVISTAKPRPRDYRQLAINAAALLSVLVVTFLVVSQLTRERFSRAPWEQEGVVAEQPPKRLTAATALLRPPAQPQGPAAAPAAAPSAQTTAAYAPPSPANRASTVRNIPMDELGPATPQVTVSGALDIPAVETSPTAEPPAEAVSPAPLIVRRGGEEDALGSPTGPEESPSDEITKRLNQALEAPSAP